jgi:hypothetical protein
MLATPKVKIKDERFQWKLPRHIHDKIKMLADYEKRNKAEEVDFLVDRRLEELKIKTNRGSGKS